MQAPILLVEDNPDDEELTLRALRKNGVARPVVVVRDGQDAVDYLFDQNGQLQADVHPPALVLLDLKLPRLGGVEVLRRIRADSTIRLTPVIIMSTSSDAGDLSSSYQQGANSYIRKPVDFQKFSEMIRQVAHYWLSLNEPAS